MSNPIIMKKIPTSQKEMEATSNTDMISLMTYSLGPNYYTSDLFEKNEEWGCNIPKSTIRSTTSEFKKPGGHLKSRGRESKDGVKHSEDVICVITNKPWYRWTGKSLVFKGEDDTAKQAMRNSCEQHNVDFIKEYIMTLTLVTMASVHNKKITRKTLNGYWRELIDGGFIEKVDPSVFEDDEIQNITQQTQPFKEDLDTIKDDSPVINQDYIIFGRPFTKEELTELPDNPKFKDLFYHVAKHIPINGDKGAEVAKKLVRGIFITYSNHLKEMEELTGKYEKLLSKNSEQVSQFSVLLQKRKELEEEIDKLTKESLPDIPFDLKGQLKDYGSVLRG